MMNQQQHNAFANGGVSLPSVTPPTFPARPLNGGKDPAKAILPGDWRHEPKANGWRALVHTPTGTMFNRRLEPLSIAGEFAKALDRLKGLPFEWLDCEALERRHDIGRGTLIVIDCVLAPATYSQRRALLESHVNLVVSDPLLVGENKVYLFPQIADLGWWWKHGQEVNQRAGCEFWEGVVSKRTNSPYPIQLRSADEGFSGWQKFRWRF